MPFAPKPPCPRCHHVRCTCPPQDTAKHSGWGQGTTKARRPSYYSAHEQKRRRDTVLAWLAVNEVGRTGEGRSIAICPDCHQPRDRWIADHVTPIAEGGDEAGPLRVHCASCSRRQGARLGNKARRRRRHE